MTTGEIIAIGAIVAGPLTAMIVSLIINWISRRKQEKHRQKINLFLTLMALRKTPPFPDEFVSSLNTIDVVFHDNKKIIEAKDKLLESQETKPFQYENYSKRLLNLLDAMSKLLGYKEIKPSDMNTPFKSIPSSSIEPEMTTVN